MALLSHEENISIKTSTIVTVLGIIPAAISILGWAFDLQYLYRISPDYPSMNLETSSIIFALSCVLLGINYVSKKNALKRLDLEIFVDKCLKFLIAAICVNLLVYLAYFLGIIDIADSIFQFMSSPRTLFATLILCLATGAFRKNSRTQTLCLMLISIPFYISIIALTGYVLSLSNLYSYFPNVGMSILTATSIVFLCFGCMYGPLKNAGNGFLLAKGQGGNAVRFGLILSIFISPTSMWLVWEGYDAHFYTQSLALVMLVVLPCMILSLSLGTVSYLLTKSEGERVHEYLKKKEIEREFFVYKEQESLRAHFEAIVESSIDAIISENAAGIITFWNQAAQDLFGYTTLELQQCGFTTLIKASDVSRYEQLRKSVLMGETLKDVEFTGVSKSKHNIDVSLTLFPIKVDGKIQEISILVRNVSWLKIELNKRTELSERLEAANRTKDIFLANLSHELRTPLNVVIGNIDLLQDFKYGSDAYVNAIDTIKRNSFAELELVESILDISRIDAGKLTIESKSFDLDRLIHHVLKSYNSAIEAKKIKLKILVDRSVKKYAGDQHKIQQILWNLISNAIKFSKKGGHIEVNARLVGSNYEIRVVDSGIGISNEAIENIFTQFWQVDSSYTKQYQGLGLGLAIAQKIANAHGGYITASSEGANKGSEFLLVLPIAKIEYIEDAQDVFEDQNGKEKEMELNSGNEEKTVVVVDDHEDSRNYLKHIIDSMGIKVHIAANGEDGIRLVHEYQPDLVLCDIGMPNMDGFEVVKEIRASRLIKHKQPMVVAVSGFASSEDRRKASEVGFDDYKIKPIIQSELKKFLTDSLDLNQELN